MASDSNPHVVQDAEMSMWDDPSFTSLYDNLGTSVESPFDGSRLFDMNGAGSVESPNYGIKNTSEEESGGQNHQNQPFHTRSLVSSHSAESSSQDSASETSGRKRQNTSATSESPPATHSHFTGVKREYDGSQQFHTNIEGTNMPSLHSLQSFGRSMHNLSLEPDFVNATQQSQMASNFDFDSAASSPGASMDMTDAAYASQIQASMNRPLTAASHKHHDPPMGTVEPSQFFFGSSTASPASVKAPHVTDASPGAMFSNPTPHSDGADLFNTNQMWNNSAQNPAWNSNYTNAFASPGGALGLTPSPVMNNAQKIPMPAASSEGGRVPLSIAPIPAKSRVETQINIRLTLDWLPTNIKNLHLPTHTIAKAKLLAKDTAPSEDTLELHTMLVCTSAMAQSHLRQRALERAAAQDNSEIQSRGQTGGGMKTEDEEEAEEDKPANGGEVRICTNCINRERKRAARKKLKKEEEQAHWEKYETERVIVFNTNEYKPWAEWQQSAAPKDSIRDSETRPPDTAMQVVAPMRIACYCRHQNEKDGFQVIFTIKDYTGKVVAQEMSDSILITDDHKTHPLATVGSQVWYDGQYPSAQYASQSMVDMHSHAQALQQSKSTSNLPSYGMLAGQPFQTPHNMHPVSAMSSQTTSGTMTPRNLSRPASPTNAGQCGPSKKRKSSSAHRRVPSTLTMTRVDTNQSMQSAPIPANTPFSPSSAGFVGGNDGSYITMPHSASRAQFHTGPSTPIDQNTPFPFGTLNRTNSMDSNAYAFYSAPSSAHQSRAPSPVLVGPNLAAFQRQQAHGAGQLSTRPNPFSMSGSSMSNTAATELDRPAPIINKINPAEGPLSGGTEVSIYGSGFTPSMTVMFGDQEAVTTTFWGEKALVALLPATGQTGTVPVTIAPSQMRQYPSPPGGQAPSFKYINKAPDMQIMELALRFYSQKETGREDQWQLFAQSAANAWISQGPMSTAHPGYPAPHPGQFADQSNDLRFAQ